MFNHRGEYSLYEGDFDTINEAVKHAVALNWCMPFIIVRVCWEPEMQSKKK